MWSSFRVGFGSRHGSVSVSQYKAGPDQDRHQNGDTTLTLESQEQNDTLGPQHTVQKKRSKFEFDSV
jgi:hypothetical protein